jgi:hypothetical protein
MTCPCFRDAAYSDTVWEIQCRLAFLDTVELCFTESLVHNGLSQQRRLHFNLGISLSLAHVWLPEHHFGLISAHLLIFCPWKELSWEADFMRISFAIYWQIRTFTCTGIDGHQSSCAMGRHSSIAVAGMHMWHDILQLSNYVTQTLWTCICTCYQCLSTIFCWTMTLSQSHR